MPGESDVRYQRIEDQTYVRKEKMWFDSFARNLPWIREGKKINELRARCIGPAVVVGAGPSVAKFGHLDKLRGVRAHVLATDKMVVPLVKAGVEPEISVTVDGSPDIAQFYSDPFATGIDAALPVFVHQPIASLVEGEVYWYVPVLDEDWNNTNKRSVTRAMLWMADHITAASAYGNAGGFAWSLAEFMGHDPIILVGIDFSYGPGVSPVETTYYKGFLEERKGNKAEVLIKDFRYEDNPFGYRVLSDAVWDGYRDIFLKGLGRTKVVTVNCSDYTTLHGSGIKTMLLEQAIKEFGL